MSKMQSLTINGNEYTVADPDAATINDPVVGQTAWSSKNIVDRLCPAFSESGAVAVCSPVAGYPLEVVSHIQPVQAGSGDPSPDNIRPITGHTVMKLSLSNDAQVQEFTLDLGQTVYGGKLNWQTGELSIDYTKLTFTGDENWTMASADENPNGTTFRLNIGVVLKNFTSQNSFKSLVTGFSSHLSQSDKSYLTSLPQNTFCWSTTGTGFRICYGQPNLGTTVEEFKQFLSEQHANGTPVEFVCQIENPITVQLTPQEILALTGTNYLYSDTGDTTVTGRGDLTAVIEKLINAMLAQGGNI